VIPATMTPKHQQIASYAPLLGELEPSRAEVPSYLPVEAQFRQSGFTLTQVKRSGDIAIYRQTKAGLPPAFEVVTIRRREASVAFGKEFPAAEYYPRNEDWGNYGFSYRTLEEAERKFKQLAKKQP